MHVAIGGITLYFILPVFFSPGCTFILGDSFVYVNTLDLVAILLIINFRAAYCRNVIYDGPVEPLEPFRCMCATECVN